MRHRQTDREWKDIETQTDRGWKDIELQTDRQRMERH